MNEPSPLVQHYAAVLRFYLFTLQGQQQVQHWMPTLCVGAALFVLLAVLLRGLRPTPRHRGQYVRGTRLVTARWGWLKRGFRSPKKLVIGGVGWPRKLEPLNLLLSGAPNTGKSQTIQGMIDTMGGRGDRAIVTDVGGEAMSRFWQNGDHLLNPLLKYSRDWSPFAEIESAADTERLAKSMIPDHQASQNPEWVGYGQGLVSAALRRLWEQREQGRATNGALLHALTLAPPSELEALVSGLPAQALFHAGAERMLASVRGIVGTHLAPYSHLQESAGVQSWSIRRHVREGKGWLWLPYEERHSAALRPLIAAWLGEAVNALLSLPPDLDRRYWLLLDEVGSIGCVQGLIDALTKGRKYGLCAILGLQSIAQLRAAFGDDGAQTLLSCLASQLIMRVNDPETAEYASSHLGDCEVVRESVTHGKDGETRTKQHHVERLVLASDIQGLKKRRGYLRLAEQNRVLRVRIPLIKRKPVIAPFTPRDPAPNKPPPSAPKPSIVVRPALDADAILGRAQVTRNEK